MRKRIVYVEPGDMIDIRICDPVFDEGANKFAWSQSLDPANILIEVVGFGGLGVVTPGVRVDRQSFPNPNTTEEVKK